ncbi:mitochondrial ribosomal protein S15 [Mycena metata]|uniref:Mitochondrial ribosomal protein S15 n=1 Tax=Mycena metata TaxID=1033252 RepID=A0AAD7JZH7_9AGAR|nr:mitochondrial ribosomal protein S15 [Mycena metata]
MLRAGVSQPCRLASVASSSSSAFHTSAVLSKLSEERLRSMALKKANVEKRTARLQAQLENRPSVILGTRPGDEDKWRKSDLAQLLVDESVFQQPPVTVKSRGVELPLYKAFGIAEAEEDTLFRILPQRSVEVTTTYDHLHAAHQQAANPLPLNPNPRESVVERLQKRVNAAEEREKAKMANFARLIDLRNSDAGGIAYENRRRIIVAFSTPENPFDPGRTEVQVAILTYRIRKLYAHLTRCKKDVQNKLSLRRLVHKRAKLLKYLRREARARYDVLLGRLGVEPDAVEGELKVT